MNHRRVRVWIARGFVARARGLLFGRRLPEGVGLLFECTRCVHGLGMGRRLDLVFLDDASVVRRVCSIGPMQIRWCRHASMVIEFEAGQQDANRWRVGEHLRPTIDTAVSRACPIGAGIGLAIGCLLLAGLMGPVREASAQMAGVFSPGWVSRFAARAESLYQAGEDAAAIQAFETVAHMDPTQAPLSALRIGNVHQRNDRSWEAMMAYRQLLTVPVPTDPAMIDARHKGLRNLVGLLEAQVQSASLAIEEGSATPVGGTIAVSRSAMALVPPAPSALSRRSATARPWMNRTPPGSAPSATGAQADLPRIEYLPTALPAARSGSRNERPAR